VIKALAIEVPPEGRPVAFAGADAFMAARTTEGKWVWWGWVPAAKAKPQSGG
jgi:hypothetical protein